MKDTRGLTMSNAHSSLDFWSNVKILIIWGLFILVLVFINNFTGISLLIWGLLLGSIGGVMQYLGFLENRKSFHEAKTMKEVRNKLKNTKWGKAYLYYLWIANLTLVIIAFIIRNNPFIDVLIGYFSLMFARELITLKPSYELSNNDKEKKSM